MSNKIFDSGNDFAIARYNGTTNLSIDDYEINKSLAVFPNPVKNNLQINLLDKTLIDNTYSILDLNGRIILKGNLSNEFNQVNLENLSKGFYILKVNNLIKKFIKE